MAYVVVANIIALIGSVFMVLASYVKSDKRCVILQSFQIFMFIISNIILKGITGVVINSLSLLRNIFAYKQKLNNYIKYMILGFMVVLSIMFNNLGIVGYLPIIGTTVFTIFINNEDTFKFRLSLSFSILMWLIYDVYIMSYSSAIFDLFSVIGGIFVLFRESKVK
ncbi:MAG: YgjV family protein [Bacilli bacterium]|nr:YgjV family protein [Bacilli bacterium]